MTSGGLGPRLSRRIRGRSGSTPGSECEFVESYAVLLYAVSHIAGGWSETEPLPCKLLERR